MLVVLGLVFSFLFFLGHTQQCFWLCTLELLPEGSGDHLGCQGSNSGWPRARQTKALPAVLYPSGPHAISYFANKRVEYWSPQTFFLLIHNASKHI